MKTTSELLEQMTNVGNKLDITTDPAVMRFLIAGRKAVRAALEASREKDTDGRSVGK
jgi:hypothetical protein